MSTIICQFQFVHYLSNPVKLPMDKGLRSIWWNLSFLIRRPMPSLVSVSSYHPLKHKQQPITQNNSNMNKHTYTPIQRWNRWLYCLILLLAFGITNSQGATAIIGTGTSTTNGSTADPIERYYNYIHFQMVWTAAELTTAGMSSGSTITAMGFSVSESAASLSNYTISMGLTSQTLANPYISSGLTVVKNPFTYSPVVQTAGNFDMITLDVPFVWDGTSSIVVNTCTGSNPFTSPYGGLRYTAATNGAVRYIRTDGSSNCATATNTNGTNRPNVRFDYSAGTPCSGTPNAGTITPSSATRCAGQTYNMVATGATTGTGISYQWQVSAVSGGPYSPVSGGTGAATTNYTTGTLAAGTYYYVCTTTCTGFGSSNSTELVLAVNAAPTVSATSDNNGAICGASSVQGNTSVNLTGSGAVTYTWSPGGATSNPVNVSPSATTVYTVTGADGAGCTSTNTVTVVVVAAPLSNTASASATTVCSGGSSTLTAATSFPANTYSVSSITYGLLSGTGTAITLSDNDDGSASVALPFSFNFFGTSYSTLYVHSNGFVSFSSGQPGGSPYTETIPTAANPNNYIAICHDDLNVTGSGAAVSYFTTGTSPNRVFVINYNAVKFYNGASNNGDMSGQIQLFEADNRVEVHVTSSNDPSASAHTIGIENAAGTLGYAATGRNNVTYSFTTPEAWRFNPDPVAGSYTWSPPTFLNNTTTNPTNASNITATTTYTATFTTTSGGCSFTSTPATVTVGAGTPPLVSIAAGGATTFCAGGSVTLTPTISDGCPGFSYAWSNGQTTPTITVSASGTYSLIITDNNNQTATSNSITVTVNPLPSVSISGGNLICGSGSVSLTASGASTYVWAPGGSTANPLTASPTSTTTYTVTGTDGNSCTATSTHTVVVSNAVVITGTSATPSDVCNGGSTSLAVSVAGPAAYCSATANSTSFEKISNVSLNTINNTSSSTAGYEDFTAVNTSLAVGTPYSVSVTVSSAYASDDRVYIWVDLNQDGVFGDPSEKLYDGAVSTFCPSCSGSSSATLTGTLTIPGSAGNGTTRMRVRLQDNSASIPNTTPCGASSFGQVEDYTVNISGGVNAYSYSWSPATFLNNTTLASPTASGMTSSETYTVTVTNSAGCTATQSVSVNVYAPFTASANADNNVSCFGGNNGAATVSASGGSGSYSYSWAPSGGTLASASGLTAGVYTVTVTDATCGTTTASVTITEPSAVSITCTPTNPSCFGGNDGQVVVSASGGTGSISGTGTFTSLSAGAYSYTVTDANGCTASCSGSLVDPPQLIASCVASDVSCPGGSNGSVTVSATGGTGAYTGTGTFGGLTAGSYNYTVTDANGCTASCSATVGTSGSNSVAPTGASASAANICLPNNVTLSVVGGSLGSGANWVWYAGACGAGAPIGTGASISYTPPSAGTYPFYVRAEGACNTTTCATVSVVVSGGQPTGTISITSAPASGCVGGSDVITTNSVLGATGYNWSGPPQVLFNGQPSPYVSATNSVTVSYSALPTGGQSGWNICVQAVNACGASPNTKCTWIRATLTQPSAITGNIIGCPSTVGTYSIPAVAGAASYQWTGTSGMTVVGTGTSATVTFGPGFTSGTLCVSGVTSCGYVGASRCMTISAAPAIPGTISGSSTICPGGSSSYSIAAVPGATSYIWSTTGSGVSVVGSGTSATVSTTSGFTAGSVCVVAVSACGANSAQRCKTISTGKLGTPGNITGDPTNGVCGQTYTYSIPPMSGATSYAWSLPSGATGSSSTNSITVTFSGGFTTGQICVNGVNGCGAGFQRCVTVNGNPSNVTGLTTSTPSPCMGTDILVTWNATNGASTYEVLVPVGYTVLTGTPTSNTFAIVNAGFSNGSIGIRANSSCGNSGTATLAITPVSCRVAGSADVAAALRTEVFPNPTTGTVNIRFNSENSDMQYVVNVTDLSGRVVLSERNKASKGSNLHTLDLSGMAKGTYLVSLLTDNGKEVVRVTVE